jgi:metal-dependent amidase/aminoacylase/carboxypeptidase family protein
MRDSTARFCLMHRRQRQIGQTMRTLSRWPPVLALWSSVFGSAQAADMTEALNNASEIVRAAYMYFHENPELGKKEVQARAYIQAQLKALGFDHFVASLKAPTAVIAILDSRRPGPVIALRAEMDARPLEDKKVEPLDHFPRSRIDGLMHNCGHDVHAAILLGTAAVLIRNQDKIGGKVVFVFQPAEETVGGADDIVNEGILETLGVEKIFAQHVAPGLQAGSIAISLTDSLKQTVDRLAKSSGVEYEWTIRAGAPATLNDAALFDKTTRPLSQVWPGPMNLLPSRGMFSEDFAYYTKSIPALYFSLGVAKDGRGTAGVHTIDFDVHPESLGNGLRLMTILALIGTTGQATW